MLLAEPDASPQGARAKVKHSPEQPGPGKSGRLHRPVTPSWLRPLHSGFMQRHATVAVTSIKAGITTLKAGQAVSFCCQTGICSASKLCASPLLAPPGKHMSHHKARTKTSTEPHANRLFPSPALISAGPGLLAVLQLLARASSHCSHERLYSLMKMAK